MIHVLAAALLLRCPLALGADVDKPARIRDAAGQQRDIREESLRTVATLKELSDELVFNRFRDPALTKNVSGVENTLEKVGNEYMERSEQELKALLDVAGDAALKGKLDEVLRLQDTILDLLRQIRNARLAADKSRLQRLLETALRNQRGAMERTKTILFDPHERVTSGKSPDDLPPLEKERLNQVSGLQDLTQHSVRKAVEEFLAASTLQDAKAPQQAEAAREVHALLSQAKVADKAAQAQADLERNRSTQALVAENEVIQSLETAIGIMANETGEADRKLSELARERDEIADLLDRQKALRKDTEALPAGAKADAMKPQEARQDRLANTAEDLKAKADEKTLARATLEQVQDAMERAEAQLSKGEKAPAVDEMKTAEKGLEAALMALEKQMEDVASGKNETAEAAEKRAEELRKEADAAAQMSKDLDAAAQKEEAIQKETQQAADQQKDAQTPAAPQESTAQIAAEQEQLQQQVQAMKQSADQQQQSAPSQQNPPMQEAARQMEQAMQAMQQASQQLRQNDPAAARQPEQAAQQSLEQAAQDLRKMEQALRKMEQAERAAALAAKLNEMAQQEAGLQQQAAKPQDPSSLQKLQKSQQDLANELARMQQQDKSLGQPAQDAEKAMKEAQSHLQEAATAMSQSQQQEQSPKGDAAMQNAKQDMMSAQAALQQMASQMQQSSEQMQQASERMRQEAQQGQKNSRAASKTQDPRGGKKDQGDATVRMGGKKNSPGWEAALSERDRVRFGQDADRAFPPEYAKLLGGYYRRLAAEKSR